MKASWNWVKARLSVFRGSLLGLCVAALLYGRNLFGDIKDAAELAEWLSTIVNSKWTIPVLFSAVVALLILEERKWRRDMGQEADARAAHLNDVKAFAAHAEALASRIAEGDAQFGRYFYLNETLKEIRVGVTGLTKTKEQLLQRAAQGPVGDDFESIRSFEYPMRSYWEQVGYLTEHYKRLKGNDGKLRSAVPALDIDNRVCDHENNLPQRFRKAYREFMIESERTEQVLADIARELDHQMSVICSQLKARGRA